MFELPEYEELRPPIMIGPGLEFIDQLAENKGYGVAYLEYLRRIGRPLQKAPIGVMDKDPYIFECIDALRVFVKCSKFINEFRLFMDKPNLYDMMLFPEYDKAINDIADAVNHLDNLLAPFNIIKVKQRSGYEILVSESTPYAMDAFTNAIGLLDTVLKYKVPLKSAEVCVRALGNLKRDEDLIKKEEREMANKIEPKTIIKKNAVKEEGPVNISFNDLMKDIHREGIVDTYEKYIGEKWSMDPSCYLNFVATYASLEFMCFMNDVVQHPRLEEIKRNYVEFLDPVMEELHEGEVPSYEKLDKSVIFGNQFSRYNKFMIHQYRRLYEFEKGIEDMGIELSHSHLFEEALNEYNYVASFVYGDDW